MKKKNWLLVLAMAAVMCFATACDNEDKDKNRGYNIGYSGYDYNAVSKDLTGKTLTVSDAEVEIKKYIIEPNMNEKDEKVITLEMDYTNNTGHDWNFEYTPFYVYQDGMEIPQLGEDVCAVIQDGVTLPITKTYALRNDTSDLEIHLFDINGKKEKSIIYITIK